MVAVARALSDGMARCYPIAVAIKQHASKEARLPSFSALALGGVAGKLRLHGIPERLIDNRLVFAKMGLLVVDDLAPIDAVLQHQVERTAGEWLATRAAARAARPQFPVDVARFHLSLHQSTRPTFVVPPKHQLPN